MSDTPDEIPWSVAWSGEQAYRIQPSRDFPGLAEIDQKQAIGVGEPLFAVIHATRQRRAMIDLLCHVCGEPTVAGERYIFPTASGGLVTLLDGTQQFGCNVPAMHKACADRAAAACPHLGKVNDFVLKCSDDDGRLIHRTDVPPGMEKLSLPIPPEVTVVYSCYRLYGPEFTQAVLAAREDWERKTRERRNSRKPAI